MPFGSSGRQKTGDSKRYGHAKATRIEGRGLVPVMPSPALDEEGWNSFDEDGEIYFDEVLEDDAEADEDEDTDDKKASPKDVATYIYVAYLNRFKQPERSEWIAISTIVGKAPP